MAQNRHAELSPSKFPAWEKCPCFESGEVGEAANKGTIEHNVLEAMMLGKQPEEKLSDEDLEKVTWAYEYVTEMAKRHEVKPAEIQVEEEVHVVDEEMNEITYGTLDIAFRDVIFDYKSGQMRDYSGQMKCYALGRMQARNLNKVWAIILYGRFKKADPIELTMQECLDYVKTMKERIEDPEKKPAKCQYCSWCKHKNCPEVTKDVMTVGKAGMSKQMAQRLNKLVKKPIDDLTPVEMNTLMPLAEAVGGWSEAMKGHCKSMLWSGKELENYQLKTKKGSLTINDQAKAKKLCGLSEKEYLAACNTTPTKLATALRASKDSKKMTVKEAKAEMYERLDSVTFSTPDTKSLERKEAKVE